MPRHRIKEVRSIVKTTPIEIRENLVDDLMDLILKTDNPVTGNPVGLPSKSILHLIQVEGLCRDIGIERLLEMAVHLNPEGTLAILKERGIKTPSWEFR